MFYQMLVERTEKELPWGSLTGIRPTKIALTRLEEGWKEEDIRSFMKETYLASDEKIDLSIEIAAREKKLLEPLDYERGYSLYVGIPFCPTTCLYCSFTSYPIGNGQGALVFIWKRCLRNWSTRHGRWREGLWIRSISAEALPRPFQRRI